MAAATCGGRASPPPLWQFSPNSNSILLILIIFSFIIHLSLCCRIVVHGCDRFRIVMQTTAMVLFLFASLFARLLFFRRKRPRGIICMTTASHDQAYEFWGQLDLLGKSRGEKDGAPCAHASTLNTLMATGKTRRATRTRGAQTREGTPTLIGNEVLQTDSSTCVWIRNATDCPTSNKPYSK